MSTLSDLTGAPRSDVLPGYTLSKVDLGQIGEIEEELCIRHLTKAAKAADRLPPSAGEAVLRRADVAVASGIFSYATPIYDQRIQERTFFPFLLYTNLKVNHPMMTREGAEKIAADHKDLPSLRRAVLEQHGFSFRVFEVPKNDEAPTQSTGGASSSDSGSADSTGTQSAA